MAPFSESHKALCLFLRQTFEVIIHYYKHTVHSHDFVLHNAPLTIPSSVCKCCNCGISWSITCAIAYA